MQNPSKRILIAEIATAHGIKGYVKVRAFVEDDALLSQPLYTTETGTKTLRLTLKNAIKNDWVAQVEGVADRNAAELLRGTKLYMDRDALPEADDGEFYIEDLKGVAVIDANDKPVGTIVSVENFGASDLLDIKPPSGPTFYLAFTDDTILEIDLEKGFVRVALPEMM